jgi:hypothetical protein
MPEKITKDVTFDPPKHGIVEIYKDGQWATAYNIAIDQVKSILKGETE